MRDVIKRVYLLMPEFGVVDGVANSLTPLSIELKRRGIDVRVFVRRPVSVSNEYGLKLKEYGVPVVSPPRILAFLGRADWETRNRILQIVVSFILSLLLIPSIVIALTQRRTLNKVWRSGAGFFSRILSPFFLADYLDHFFHAQLAWYVRRYPPDVIEVSRRDYTAVIEWSTSRGIPTIYKECGTPSAWSYVQKEQLNKAACIITKSIAAKEAMQALSDFQGPIFVVPNALNGMGRKPSEPLSIYEGGSTTILAYVGRLSSEKGVQYLPEVLDWIVEKVQDVTLIIVGDGPLKSQLERSFTDRKIAAYVRFLGVVNHDRVLEILKETDILLLPSLTEGLPNVVIEAMACGTAIVATAVGGTPELIRDGIWGMLVQPGDPHSMAQAVISLVHNEAVRQQLGRMARQVYENGPWTPQAAGNLSLEVYRYAKRVGNYA